MEGYSAGLNLNCTNKKNHEAGIVEWIALVAFIFYKHPFIYLVKSMKSFLLNSFNSESTNLIYAVICQGYEEEYKEETGCPVKQWRGHCRKYKKKL